MNKIVRNVLMIVASLLMSGCSILSPVKVSPTTTYVFAPKSCGLQSKAHSRTTIYVALPETMAAFNSTQMAYSLRKFHLAYYAKNQWAASPSDMLHPLLVQAIQQTHYYKAVISQPYQGHYDYILNTQILNLTQDYRRRPPSVKLTLRSQITRRSDNRVLGTKQIGLWIPMREFTPYGGVIAINEGLENILREIAIFAIQQGRGG